VAGYGSGARHQIRLPAIADMGEIMAGWRLNAPQRMPSASPRRVARRTPLPASRLLAAALPAR